MSKIAKSVNEGVELVNIEIENNGEAYLDWGAISNE